MSGRGLRVRFDLPRAELERAQQDASKHAANFESFARDTAFDAGHLFGRVHFDLAVPFEPDPVLNFLKARRGLRAEPPLTVSIDQPVAHLVGQLAGAAVLTLHGEGPRMVRLSGGRGAVGLESRGGDLLLSLPLEAYAGAAAVGAPDAASAVADAASCLAAMLCDHAPSLSGWSLLSFLRREERILRAVEARAELQAAAHDGGAGSATTVDLARFAMRGAPSPAEAAEEAEQAGAHVVPYWDVRVDDAGGGLTFAPVGAPAGEAARGALARFIFPGEVRVLQPVIGPNEEATARLRGRLRRQAPFRVGVDPATGELAAIVEGPQAAPRG